MKSPKKFTSILAGILAVVMVLSLFLSLVPGASAASSSELRKQIDAMKKTQQELRERMAGIESDMAENENEILEMVGKKNVIDQEIAILYAEIDNINQQISAYNLLIADQQALLEEAQLHYTQLSDKYKDRIRAMEEEGEVSYWSVLFKANSFSDLLDRLNMVQEIAAADKRRLEELRAAADAVDAAKQELQLQKDEVEETRAGLSATEAELEGKRADAMKILQDLMAQGADFEKLLREAESEEDSLQSELSDLQAEYNAAKESEEEAYWAAYWATYVPPTTEAPTQATRPTTESATQATEKPGSTEATTATEATTPTTEATTPPEPTKPSVSGERWIIPTSYTYLSSPFGEREAPVAGASTFHNGVDLAAPENTPIVASRSGTVLKANHSSSGGNQVVIDHGDGFKSYYLHMTRYVVGAGQKVTQGQVIGYVGSTGISSGNHLHFGIRTSSGYVNPAAYISFY